MSTDGYRGEETLEFFLVARLDSKKALMILSLRSWVVTYIGNVKTFPIGLACSDHSL